MPPERELGEQFEVSRTVVREAVRALDARGLLEVRVGSRIKVAAVKPRIVSEAIRHFVRSRDIDGRAIAEIAAAMDVAAVGLAAARANGTDRQRIAAALEGVERGSDAAGAESAFREAVLAAAHEELVTMLAETMSSLGESLPTTQRPELGTPACRAVALAISRRDPKEARRALLQCLE